MRHHIGVVGWYRLVATSICIDAFPVFEENRDYSLELREVFIERLVAHLNAIAKQNDATRLGSFRAPAKEENGSILIIDVEPENEGDVPWQI